MQHQPRPQSRAGPDRSNQSNFRTSAAGHLQTALELCKARSQKPTAAQVCTTIELLGGQRCTVRHCLACTGQAAADSPELQPSKPASQPTPAGRLQVDHLLQMKHLMPGVVTVQRAPLAALQDCLISLKAAAPTAQDPPATRAATDQAACPGPPTAPAAPLSPASLKAAFAARLQLHRQHSLCTDTQEPSSALKASNAGQLAECPSTPAACIPLAMISPLRSCAHTGARSALQGGPRGGSAPAPRSSQGLGFTCTKDPRGSTTQKKLLFQDTPRYGLGGPHLQQQLDSSCPPAAAVATPESSLQRKLRRQAEGGLLPISLNVLQVRAGLGASSVE